MIYIVTGHPRSGTSMMMQALESGGIPVVKSDERDKFCDERSDSSYSMNFSGLWEASVAQMKQSDFPMCHEGHAVKVVFGNLHFVRPHWYSVENGHAPLYRPGYRVLLMVRHPEEVRQSSWSSFIPLDRKILSAEECRKWWCHYGELLRKTLQFFKRRKDVLSISIIHYRKLVASPVKAFEYLRSEGWPVIPELAASTVDQAQVRFRIENLEIGL